MAIKMRQSRQKDATPALLISEAIRLGSEYRRVAETAQFYRELLVNKSIADTIRECNSILGMAGVFKNGCLYRECGLSEFWKTADGDLVVCDHAVPVSALVEQHVKRLRPIEELIFSPVVRITRKSNEELTRLGFAKKGTKHGFPLFRYSHIGMKITAHKGFDIDPLTWSDDDHWRLVQETEELRPVLQVLKILRLGG